MCIRDSSKKIFEKLLAKVKRFDYEFQAACVKEQNFEKLEMYVMELLMGCLLYTSAPPAALSFPLRGKR